MRMLLILFFIAATNADHFLWFENEPDLEDPCTLVVVGGERGMLTCHHLPATCTDHGAFFNWANFGRVWLHLYVDVEKKQEFQVCLTGGAPESTYVWYDYARRHWEPLVFPAWFGDAPAQDNCKKSINGTMDLFFEPPWWYVNYAAYVTWNVTFIEDYQPKPWPPGKPIEKPFTDVDAEMFKPAHLKKRKEDREKMKKLIAKEKKAQKEKDKKDKKKKKKTKKDKEDKSKDKKDKKDKKKPRPQWR